jgi:hypothetical protein
MPKCFVCNGDGNYINPVLWDGIGGGELIKCELCNGKGKISLLLWLRSRFWRYDSL